jgi:hypothetical protein
VSRKRKERQEREDWSDEEIVFLQTSFADFELK